MRPYTAERRYPIVRHALSLALVAMGATPAISAFAQETIPPASEAPPATPSAPEPTETPPSAAAAPPEPPPVVLPPEPPPAPAESAPKPAFRYSVPWQLRPLPVPNVARLDSILGLDEDKASRRGTTVLSQLTLAARIPGTGPAREGLGVVLRGGLVHDAQPSGADAWVMTNLMVGAAYGIALPHDLLLNFALGTALPLGSGGGDHPDPAAAAARSRAASARFGFDNPLLGTNDFSIIPGVGFGWVADGWTLQAEATMSQAWRVRGSKAQKESTKTNSGFALHVGKFLAPFASINTELRYQHWVNAPFAVEKDKTDASWDNLSFTVGPRFHVKLGSVWIRPGIAYARALDKPLAAAAPNLHVFQLDIPVFF